MIYYKVLLKLYQSKRILYKKKTKSLTLVSKLEVLVLNYIKLKQPLKVF